MSDGRCQRRADVTVVCGVQHDVSMPSGSTCRVVVHRGTESSAAPDAAAIVTLDAVEHAAVLYVLGAGCMDPLARTELGAALAEQLGLDGAATFHLLIAMRRLCAVARRDNDA